MTCSSLGRCRVRQRADRWRRRRSLQDRPIGWPLDGRWQVEHGCGHGDFQRVWGKYSTLKAIIARRTDVWNIGRFGPPFQPLAGRNPDAVHDSTTGPAPGRQGPSLDLALVETTPSAIKPPTWPALPGVLEKSALKPIAEGYWATMQGQSVIADALFAFHLIGQNRWTTTN